MNVRARGKFPIFCAAELCDYGLARKAKNVSMSLCVQCSNFARQLFGATCRNISEEPVESRKPSNSDGCPTLQMIARMTPCHMGVLRFLSHEHLLGKVSSRTRQNAYVVYVCHVLHSHGAKYGTVLKYVVL